MAVSNLHGYTERRRRQKALDENGMFDFRSRTLTCICPKAIHPGWSRSKWFLMLGWGHDAELNQDTSEPNPEDTASWFSFIFFTHYDGLIMKAFKSPHLKIDDLPPLATPHKSGYLSRETSQVSSKDCWTRAIAHIDCSTLTHCVLVARDTSLWNWYFKFSVRPSPLRIFKTYIIYMECSSYGACANGPAPTPLRE